MKKIIEIKQQILENKELVKFLEENKIRFVIKEVQTGNCLNCEKEFVLRGIGTSNEKKFCSFECRSRFNARMQYEFKQKYSEEYRRKKKEYFEKWRKENREHFNELEREPNRIRGKENYDKWDKESLCVRCGKERDNPNSKTCLKCKPLKELGGSRRKQNFTRGLFGDNENNVRR